MSNEDYSYKQHTRSKFVEYDESINYKRPTKLGNISLKSNKKQSCIPLLNINRNNTDKNLALDYYSMNGRSKSPNDIYLLTSPKSNNKCKTGNDKGTYAHLLGQLTKKKTHCLKESKTMLQLKANYSLIKKTILNKDCESLIKITMNDNDNSNIDKTEAEKYEREMIYLKESIDSKGNPFLKKNKYKMKDLKAKIKEMQRIVRVMKRVCDYTCPLTFVARNNLLSMNKKNAQHLNNRTNTPKENKYYLGSFCVPASMIYVAK